jgi:hypothetical protein
MTQPQPLKFMLPDWLTMNAAFERIVDGCGSRDLAAGELHQALLSGRLRSGAVRLRLRSGRPVPVTAADNTLLDQVFWKQFELYAFGGKLRCRPAAGYGYGAESWYFYVLAADVDRHYQLTKAVKPSSRQRGTKLKYDWGPIEAEVVRRCCDKSGQFKTPDNVSKLAADMCLWCGEHGCDDDKIPAINTMRRRIDSLVARNCS